MFSEQQGDEPGDFWRALGGRPTRPIDVSIITLWEQEESNLQNFFLNNACKNDGKTAIGDKHLFSWIQTQNNFKRYLGVLCTSFHFHQLFYLSIFLQ